MIIGKDYKCKEDKVKNNYYIINFVFDSFEACIYIRIKMMIYYFILN